MKSYFDFNSKLKVLLREFEREGEYSSFSLFKELVKKYREEIEDKMLPLCENKIRKRIILDNIKYEEKKEYISYLKNKYENFYLLVDIFGDDLRVAVKFSIDNFINKILSKFDCRVSDIKEFKKYVFESFLEDTFEKPRDCFKSIICLYFEDFFRKYNIYLERERRYIIKSIEWNLYVSESFEDDYWADFLIDLEIFENFLELNKNYLREAIKKFMNELFSKRDDKKWRDIFENYIKSYSLPNFYNLDKNLFIQNLSNSIAEYFIRESDIFKAFATGKRELIKISEKVKVFGEEFVLKMKKFRDEMESGDIIDFVLENNELRKNISKIVSNYC